MISPRQLRDLKNAMPFRPFKIHMADGKIYDVPHHGAVFVLQDFLRVGVDFNQTGIPARAVTCELSQISRVEECL